MDVYGGILSPYVARVILTARHKGIKHKLKMPTGGLKSPEFLALNPMGKIPTIKDGSTVLYESSVIVDYLEAKYKKKRIIPASAKDAAKARLIATVFSEYVQGPTLALFRQRDPAKRDQKIVEEKLAEINRGLDVVEKLLCLCSAMLVLHGRHVALVWHGRSRGRPKETDKVCCQSEKRQTDSNNFG